MKIRELPMAGRVAERYPVLAEQPIGEAVVSVMRQIKNGWTPGGARELQRQSSELRSAIDELDWSTGKLLIQVGANDGEFDDPLRPLLKETEIPAILVEPVGIAFDALQKLYKDRPNITTVQAAIAREAGSISLHVPLVEGRELYSTAWACRTERQARREVKRNLGKRSLGSTEFKEIKIPAISAADLLRNRGVAPSEVQVVVCDTEGQDVEIIQSFLDAEARPKIVYYEQLHTDQGESVELKERLIEAGYSVEESHKDVFARL